MAYKKIVDDQIVEIDEDFELEGIQLNPTSEERLEAVEAAVLDLILKGE